MAVDLRKKANEIRIKTYETISGAGGGHYGGALSEIEILTALYFNEMRIDPQNPKKPDRDRFILSKGHGGPGLYTTLAVRGFFPEEKLSELDKNGGMLPKHVDRFKVPGVDVSSGALGQGLSIANGMALATKTDKSDVRVYVVIGDGECNEGQVWEAAMTSAKYKLDNLTAIIDLNKVQVDGTTDEVMPLGSMKEKWEAFGWNVIEVDGHDVCKICESIDIAKKTKGKPTVLIADTIKGKGVSFMEGRFEWHAGGTTEEQYNQGLAELKGLKTC